MAEVSTEAMEEVSTEAIAGALIQAIEGVMVEPLSGVLAGALAAADCRCIGTAGGWVFFRDVGSIVVRSRGQGQGRWQKW